MYLQFRTDGQIRPSRAEVESAIHSIDPAVPQVLAVQVRGGEFTVLHNETEVLRAEDGTYSSGTIGLRVVDTHAVFSDLRFEGFGVADSVRLSTREIFDHA